MQWWKSAILATLALATGTIALAGTKIVWPPGPEGRGAPARTVGSGIRGTCVSTAEIPAFPLVRNDTVMDAGTIRPIVFAYLPAADAESAILTVRSATTGKIVGGVKEFDVGELPAIVGVRVPGELNAGESYRWSIAIDCGSGREDAYGDLRRVAVTGMPPTENLARAQWYVDRGLWHDMLETLAADSELWQSFMDDWQWESDNFSEEDFSALREVPVVLIE